MRRVDRRADAGWDYASITFIDRVAEEGIRPSGGSAADAHVNALMECVTCPFKTEQVTPDSCHGGVSLSVDPECVEDALDGGRDRVGGDVFVAGDADADLLDRAQGLDDLLDAQLSDVLQVAVDREGREHDGEVGLDRLAGVVYIGRAARSVLDIRKDCSTCHRSW